MTKTTNGQLSVKGQAKTAAPPEEGGDNTRAAYKWLSDNKHNLSVTSEFKDVADLHLRSAAGSWFYH